MSSFETFSKRQKKRERAGQADVYHYDTLPEPFRIQVIHIWSTAIGQYFHLDRFELGYRAEPLSNRCWQRIHDTLARELGVFSLGNGGNAFSQCQEYLLKTDTQGALDIIDLTFLFIHTALRNADPQERRSSQIRQESDDAIQELNLRFQEHSIGYQFAQGELLRIDSQYIHAKVVKPALSLLQAMQFQGALDEFLRSHEHYRKGNKKEAIIESLKALESTMKTICDLRGWHYSNGTAKELIDIIFDKELIPKSLTAHFSGLRSI